VKLSEHENLKIRVWWQKAPSKLRNGGRKRHQNVKVMAKNATIKTKTANVSSKKLVAKNAIKTMKWWQKTPPKYQNGGRKCHHSIKKRVLGRFSP